MRLRLELKAGKGTTAGFVIPDEAVAALGSSRRPAVRATVNGYTWRSSIARMGDQFMLGMSNAVRTEAGVAAGQVLDLDIELDTDKREVTVPHDLAAALAAEPAAKAAFEKLAYSHQRAHVEQVVGAKAAETRARRVARIVAALKP
jgi:hypothetical protein